MVAGSTDRNHFPGWLSPGYKWIFGIGTIHIFIILVYMKSTPSNKDSILAITLLLLLIFLYNRNLNTIYVATIFILLCLISNSVAAFFHLLWFKLTHYLGMVSSAIILSIIFYAIVFPLGLLLKLFKKDPLIRKINNHTSTFDTRNKLFNEADLQNPF